MLIIHEYGEPSHYIGTLEACKIKNEKVRFVEFSTSKLIIKSLKNKNYSGVSKAIKDFVSLSFWFFFPFFLKDKNIVIGMAPLDNRVFFFNRMLKYANVTYHSSWVIWDGSKFPKRRIFFNRYFLRLWHFFLTNRVSFFAVVTETVKNQLIAHMGIQKNKIKVVYHAYDENIFNRSKINKLSSRTPAVIYIGRLVESKGINDILSLAERNKKINFYILGKGNLENEIISAAEKNENIKFIGYVKEKEKIADYCNRSDIILLPSKRKKDWEELFGMVLIEAMACGCIPICTDHTGPKTILNASFWKSHLIQEENFVKEAENLMNKYLFNTVLLEEGKSIAEETAATYSKKSIGHIWAELFKGNKE